MKRKLLTLFSLSIANLCFSQTTVNFNYTGSLQTFTVPSCVTSITIQAQGASGGNSTWSTLRTGGFGTNMTGTFNVTPGQVIQIMVGQAGESAAVGGGGGGTFVVNQSNGQPMIVAGGGGGASSDQNGVNAVIGPNGTMDGLNIIAGGTGGNGGNACGPLSPNNNGGGGGGFLTNGQSNNNGSGNGGFGGFAFVNGGAGGAPGRLDLACTQDAYGGYGGGGSTSCNTVGGGGGGGYSGGAGGPHVSQCGASIRAGGGGGGSFNSGTNPINTVATTTGNGWVSIVYTPSAPPSSPTITSGSSAVCDGSTQTYTISSVAGATSYTWTVPAGSTITSGQGTTTITVTMGSNSGFFSVTANNTCGSSAPTTLPVSVNLLPTVIAYAAAGTICAGATETLSASGASSYVWSSGGNAPTETVSPSSTTTYTVTGTDANGCSNTATVTVNVNQLPTITVAASAPAVCAGTNDTLTAGGAATYAWSSGGNAATEIVAPSSTTSYTVTGTDANGCVNTATISVNVNALPVVALGADIAQCEGTVTLDAQNSGATFAWSTGGSSQTETVAATGVYSVVVTDANGCSNSDTISVTINSNPAVNLGPDSAQCGGSIMVDAGFQGSSYVWSDNSNAQTLVVTTTGTYYVTVTDVNGCVGADTINITINTPPTVTASASATNVCLDDANVTLTGSPNGGTWAGPGVTGNSFDPSVGAGPHVITYSYTDANGCEGTTVITVNVNACVGFAETTLANGVSVYPNPSNGTFTIAVNANVGDLVIEITDMQGRLVYKSNENNVQSGFSRQITMENKADGMYMIRLTSANESHIIRMNVTK